MLGCKCKPQFPLIQGAFPATVISRRPELSYFRKLLTPELTKFLNSTSTLTLFLPVDNAWSALSPLDRLYLESEFGADDLRHILNMHAVLLEEKQVKWSDSFKEPVNSALFYLSLPLGH